MAAPDEQAASPVRVLRLEDALRIARERQPALRKARADTSLAEARLEAARAPLLPQLLGTASYQRTTGNFVPRPGQVPRSVSTNSGPSADRDPLSLYNFFNFGLTANQVLYDFGASTGSYEANRELVHAQESSARAVEQDVAMLVGTAFSAGARVPGIGRRRAGESRQCGAPSAPDAGLRGRR